MNLLYATTNRQRRQAVQDDPTLNGIDSIEVVESRSTDAATGAASRTLLLRLFKPSAGLTRENVRIEGMIGPNASQAIDIVWATPASPLSEPAEPIFSDEERIRFASLLDAANVLVVRVGATGDFPAYRLSLVQSASDPTPPSGFDPALAAVDFALEIEPASRVQYRCADEDRRQLVADSPHLNGIDFLEVVDRESPLASLRQRTLLVRCFKPTAGITANNIVIEGGTRVTPVRALWAFPADQVPGQVASAAERALYAALDEPQNVLVTRVDSSGDFSIYTLLIVQSSENSSPLLGFDPRLSTVDFSFKVGCPSDFDCADGNVCAPEPREEPNLDYLAKDYDSFRRLMFDRLAVTMPSWKERNPADVQVALVEMLAYVGDHLSYYQDAVATEAYLGTARKRVSVRRHARLLDYTMHDGCNARAWIAFEVEPGGSADGMTLPRGTGLSTESGTGSSTTAGTTSSGDSVIFETMDDLLLHSDRNLITFHTWSDGDCCLPKGATRATLLREGSLTLAPGDLLLFEEVISPTTGLAPDADRTRRHIVRLTVAAATFDPLDGTPIVNIEWNADDALPFPLCISSRVDDTTVYRNVSVARGNIVPADHGRTIVEELTPRDVPGGRDFRYRLSERSLTFGEPYDPSRPANSAAGRDPRLALPAIELSQGDVIWSPQQDLLASDQFARDFVVETESDGSAYIRFGDGQHGREPDDDVPIIARYRVGVGPTGIVGIEAINRPLSAIDGIVGVRNPLPTSGGIEPESMEQVRRFAPWAFRTQERAVTEADYAEVAGRHPDVQKAAATFRWTGSWHTAFVTIDRIGGRTVDAAFKEELAEYLERFRIVGYDLEVNGPVFVPLDIRLKVCVKAGYFRENVKQALLKAFGAQPLATGGRGFFHPDNFTFAQPVYLSRIYRTALDTPGVDSVEVIKFQRWGKSANNEIQQGMITPGALEVIRLDNDPNFPENGRIAFDMGGGL